MWVYPWRAYYSFVNASGVREAVAFGPKIFSLEQNFPNPFNPATTIRYSTPRRSHVTLAVFNVLGQEVAELINGHIEAGSHEVQFNAHGLASGLYLYRMKAGDFVRTLKLHVLK
jgi:hypothetical protein